MLKFDNTDEIISFALSLIRPATASLSRSTKTRASSDVNRFANSSTSMSEVSVIEHTYGREISDLIKTMQAKGKYPLKQIKKKSLFMKWNILWFSMNSFFISDKIFDLSIFNKALNKCVLPCWQRPNKLSFY